MNPEVVSVRCEPEGKLLLSFDNGETRRFDATPYFAFPAFNRLNDPAYFRLARADHGTVVWPAEEDFCPDTLYLESTHA